MRPSATPRLRRHRLRLVLGLLGMSLLAAPKAALAQYKNSIFALDLAGTFLTRPGVVDDQGNILGNNQLPLRLAYGERVGADIGFKLNSDHWWFMGRVNFALFSFATWGESPGDLHYEYDLTSQQVIGTVLGLQGMPGIRYYFLTDRTRPYLQLGLSYMRLFSFSGQAGDSCTLGICSGGGTYGDVFLPHANILALHLQPGIEFIVKRDLAIHLALDYQRWLIINASGNNAFNLVLGVTFYS